MGRIGGRSSGVDTPWGGAGTDRYSGWNSIPNFCFWFCVGACFSKWELVRVFQNGIRASRWRYLRPADNLKYVDFASAEASSACCGVNLAAARAGEAFFRGAEGFFMAGAERHGGRAAGGLLAGAGGCWRALVRAGESWGRHEEFRRDVRSWRALLRGEWGGAFSIVRGHRPEWADGKRASLVDGLDSGRRRGILPLNAPASPGS
jgi:hypothetical protein